MPNKKYIELQKGGLLNVQSKMTQYIVHEMLLAPPYFYISTRFNEHKTTVNLCTYKQRGKYQ